MLFSSIFYVIGCFVIASILTVFKTMLKPSHRRDDNRSWVVFLIFFALCIGSPYVFMEVETKTYGPSMDKAIKEVYAGFDVWGPMNYYKVRWCWHDKASVYVVAKEKQSWGGYDYPVFALNMVKEDGKWKVDSYKPVDFPRINKDGITFPPMW